MSGARGGALAGASTPAAGIPLARPDAELREVEAEVREAFERVLSRGVFTAGPEVEAFEAELAAYLDAPHAVAVASGSQAITIALRALGVGPGDEVVSVANVDVSVSAPVSHTGARLVFADVDPATHTMDPASLERAISAHTRAVLVVHLYGNPADMDAIGAVAREHGLAVVEDASHAPGATWQGRHCGTLADVGCFSLSAGKPLGAAGSAGAIVTHNGRVAREARLLAHYGIVPAALRAIRAGRPGTRFRCAAEGHNAGLDELQAAVLRAKLARLPGWVERRRRHAATYREVLRAAAPPGLELPAVHPGAEPAWRVFVVRAPRRDSLVAALARDGVATSLYYVPPLHLQGLYRRRALERLPGTERAARELLCLPAFPQLDDHEVRTAAERLAELAGGPL